MLAGDPQAAERVRTALDTRQDLNVSVATGQELAAQSRRGTPRRFVVFLDPGRALPSATSPGDRSDDGCRDEWRQMHSALADVTVDAHAADLMQIVERSFTAHAGAALRVRVS